MFNKIRTLVSFIDLLGCALGASIILMLIFAESKKQAGMEAGSPRDFMYAEFKINRPDAYIQIYFKTPDKEIVSFDLKEGKPQYTDDGFIKLTNSNFYAWGPFYKKKGNSEFDPNSKYFAIYGTSEKKNDWEFAITYFSDGTLNWDNQLLANKTSKEITKKLKEASTQIEFRFQNISRDTTFTSLPLIMGQTKVFDSIFTKE